MPATLPGGVAGLEVVLGGGALALIGHAVAPVGNLVSLVGDPVPFVRDPLTLIGSPFAFVGGLVAPIRRILFVHRPRRTPRGALVRGNLAPSRRA